MTTIDLSRFGQSERRTVIDILTSWNEKGLPEKFEADEIQLMMNEDSGYVFLTNSEFQVAMINGDQLEVFHTCPICGMEGFKEEFNNHGDEECKDWEREMI